MGLIVAIFGLRARVAALEAHVATMTVRAAVEAPGPRAPEARSGSVSQRESSPMGDVRALVRAGQKLNAIKRYRELTGLGLQEAKEAVDAMDHDA